ncbi:glutamate dehydrogenase [Sulfolobus metallicus DSM 6482 = JCM 9184]|uniref:Glutamate dehydrogenase n=1 Tax=Sulfuracidifex metallicus DSM 6482 = JCM 9184 TaxID=523847 RepID=A0A6A9QU25_SULME|nr:Glu/Leu/Phe/Val dehydrogenase [Sulfuracidifex metallicus]MUN29303.1 glutamate dehydrogenase [Sulfuracidifex metallicus DSM 6482 = JCM 9184]
MSLISDIVTSDLYTQQLKKLERVSQILSLENDVIESLSQPERVIQVKVNLKGNDGRVKTFIGWRSQHNSALGPYKGGVRFSPNVTQTEVMALSMMMTWKNSLLGLPYGGGKGGIRVDPKSLHRDELERLSRGYVKAIYNYIGSDIDIPAPDLNTDPQIMAWFLDEYIKVSGKVDFATFTGKPVEIGGLSVREYSTGLGLATITKVATEKILDGIEGKRIIIQGFGNVGYYAAKFLTEMGGKVIGVSDSKGGIITENGIDPEKVLELKKNGEPISSYEGKKVTNEQLLTWDCDILIPAAVENVINKTNASQVKAKIIVEGANGPLTADADDILRRNNVTVIPDILANSGGVVGSYVEWANNKMGDIVEDEEAKKLIITRMEKAFNNMYQEHEKKFSEYDFRTSAMAIAIERVVRASKLRGLM